MHKHVLPIFWLVAFFLLASCSQKSTSPAPVPATTFPVSLPTLAQDGFKQSSGEPRTAGYWLIWNACLPGNKAETARANGGREAGWVILDDLLADPGVLIGDLDVKTCQQGVDLLQARDPAGLDQSADPAYTLAAQLFIAQLNLAASAETCPAAEQAVQAAQLLLLSLRFDGTGSYLAQPVNSQERDTALILTDQLVNYNTGSLCVP